MVRTHISLLLALYAQSLQAEDAPAGHEQKLHSVTVDADGQPSANVLREAEAAAEVSEKGAHDMLLKLFDQNKDHCVDQAEFIDAAMMGPMHVLAANQWPLKHLKGRKLEAEGAKWCPKQNSTDFLLNMMSTMMGDVGGVKAGPFYMPKICKDGKKNSNTMGGSCKMIAELATGPMLLNLPGGMSDAISGSVFEMCKLLFPGPCLTETDPSMEKFERLAIASMAAVKLEGEKTEALLKDSPEDFDSKVTNGLYKSDHYNTPEGGWDETVKCGSGWTGKYVEKNTTLEDIDINKITMSSPTFTPVTLVLMLQELVMGPGMLKEIRELNEDYPEGPVEASVYVAESTSGKGVCVIAFQETQGTGSKNFGPDWKVNMNAELVEFSEGGKVHKGYLSAFDLMAPIVKTLAETAGCTDSTKISDVLFAGYSAGGGMASVFFAAAKKKWSWLGDDITARLVTMGAPPVGDVEFCETHFDDGMALQIVAFDDPYPAMKISGDVGVIALGALQIHQCTLTKWITCPADVVAGAYPKKDCHDSKLVYFPWADANTDTEMCGTLR